jgi:hypothetical protein
LRDANALAVIKGTTDLGKMKLPGLFLLLSFSGACSAQLKVEKLNKSTIPQNTRYTGNIIEAARWKDALGDNLVILTTEKTQSKNASDNGTDASLYAYHYLVKGDSSKQTWKVYDHVKACPVDIFLYFVEKSFAVTDLDKNGKAEVWLMYKNSCQGDVSPVSMKIIMYENNKKFALRGTTKVQASATEHMGGQFVFDEAFKKAPVAFRQYAEKLWQKHKIENWKQ